jgi:hypothetical protein
MAIKPFNSVQGFSVGEEPSNIILANGDITTTNITANGISNLGPVSNLILTGGSNGQVVTTDGLGNLTFTTVSSGSSNLAAPMPYFIPTGESYTVSNNFQGLFNLPITIDGELEVDGVLIEVDGGGSGTGSPGGSNTQIQYNDSGIFNGSANLTFNKTTGVITVPNLVVSSNTTLGNMSALGNLAITGNVTVSADLFVSGSQVEPLVLATAQIASGTSVDFTGIPSWVKRITVIFSGVSTDGTSLKLLQLGSGSIQTTGYTATSTFLGGSTGVTSNTNGFIIYSNTAAEIMSGTIVLTLLSGNTWIASGVIKNSTTYMAYAAGDVTLASALDRIRLTTVNGTDTFDTGTVNIMYE